jgi:hypothetical protein
LTLRFIAQAFQPAKYSTLFHHKRPGPFITGSISIVGDERLGVCDGARWAFVVKKKS